MQGVRNGSLVIQLFTSKAFLPGKLIYILIKNNGSEHIHAALKFKVQRQVVPLGSFAQALKAPKDSFDLYVKTRQYFDHVDIKVGQKH